MLDQFIYRLRVLRQDRRGVAAIEAALLLPLLTLAGFGVIDASLLLLQNHKMENGLAAAGNYLSKAPNPNSVEVQAKRLATTGHVKAGGKALIAGWSDAAVTITYRSVSNNAGNYRGGNNVRVVRLTSQTPYQGLGLIKAISGGSLFLKASYENRLVSERT